MSGPFNRAGINRGVSSTAEPAILGDQTVQVIAAAILDINGTPMLASDVSAQEITDLLGLEVSNVVDNGDNTYTVSATDGTSFTINTGTGEDPRLFTQSGEPSTSNPNGSIWVNTAPNPHEVYLLNTCLLYTSPSPRDS